MDLYHALPTTHPLRLSLPEPNAIVATDYCNLSPYRIALWRRLLKFLLTDWFLLNHSYEMLALPLPTDEEKLQVWTLTMSNFAATIPGDDLKDIIVKTENASDDEKKDINSWTPGEIANLVVSMSAIGGTIGGVSYLIYKLRDLRNSADVPINSLGDLMRWWLTTREGASGLAAGAAVSSVLGPSAGASAALNASVAAGVLNRGPAPEGIPENINAINAAMEVPTFEMATFKNVLDLTGSYPMAFGAAGTAFLTRKVGGVTYIYRTTKASANSVASKFRTVLADNWSRVARRPISEAEVDIPYQAMEDIPAQQSSEWIEKIVRKKFRESRLTRYTENPGEKPAPMESAEGAEWGKVQWGSATIEDGGSSWSVVPEAADPLPLTVRQSDYDPLASLLEEKEMVRSAVEGPRSMESSELFINKMDKIIGWTKQKLSVAKSKAEDPVSLEGSVKMPSMKGFKKIGALIEKAKPKYGQNEPEKEPVNDPVEVDDPFAAILARAEKHVATYQEDIKRWDAAAAEAKAKAGPVEAPAPEAATAEAPAPEVLQAAEGDGRAAAEGGDVAGAVGEALEAAGVDVAEEVGGVVLSDVLASAFGVFCAVGSVVMTVADPIMWVIQIYDLGKFIDSEVKEPKERKSIQVTLEKAESDYKTKLQILVDKAGIGPLPEHEYTYREYVSAGFIWSPPSKYATAMMPFLYDYPEKPCLDYLQMRIDNPSICEPDILTGLLHVREIYRSWIPPYVLRAYPEWSSLEFINLLDYHLTMEDLLQHSTDTFDVAFDLNKARTDCRARFSRAYFACYQYTMGIIIDKNWTNMQKELREYLLAHKTLNQTGEVTYAQVMLRYLIHPSKLQVTPRPLVIYDELKKITFRMGQLLVQLIAHEFRTYSNKQEPLPITHHATGKNSSNLHFSDHESPPIHYTMTNYGQTIPYTVNDTYQGFKLPYRFKNNTDAPINLRTVLKAVWKKVLIMSYESYESFNGVSIALGRDEITGDIFCALSMASASSVLCSRMDKDNIIYVREYCYAGDDKNETLTPSNDQEGTFLKDTMNPIVIHEVNAKHRDYIVMANGSSHLSICELEQNRAFEVHITDETITFENMIDSRGNFSSATKPALPATPRPPTQRPTPGTTAPTSRPTPRPSPAPVITTHSLTPPTQPPSLQRPTPPKKRTRETPPTTLQIAHTLLVVNSTLLERCPLEIVEADELVTQLSKLSIPAEPTTEVYELCGQGATVEYYCGSDGKTRCFITDQNTIKIVEISEKQYPGLIMPRAENLLGVGAGLGGAVYMSVLLINKASIVPKMTMLVIGFLQSAVSAFNFADGLVGATTGVLTDMAIQGSQNAVSSTGLVLLSSAQLISSATNIVGDGLVRAGEALWPAASITYKVLPVVIATVQVTKDTVTGIYSVFSFKNVIATVILSSIETRLFGTEIIRNTAIDTVYGVGNTFIDITGARRVPQRVGELATLLGTRATETLDAASETLDAARDRMTNTGFGAAGLMLVLAGAILISSE